MLTRRGLSTLGTGVALVVGGSLLTSPEFVIAGLLILFVVIGCVISVWLPMHRPAKLQRSTEPRQPFAGAGVRVTLATSAPSSRVFITERLPAGNSITAGLSADRNQPTQSLSYITTPLPRGVTRLGPAIATRTDFLRLARRQYSANDETALLVWPTIVPVDETQIESLSRTSSPKRNARAPKLDPRKRGAAFEGDLRAYVPGDEPKRVHWPSSAKAQQLIVRTDALPEPAEDHSITVDLSPSAHTDATFELAANAMGSIVAALAGIDRASAPFDAALRVQIHIDGEYSFLRSLKELLDVLACADAPGVSPKANGDANRSGKSTQNGRRLLGSENGPGGRRIGSRQGIRAGGLLVIGPNSNSALLSGRTFAIRCTEPSNAMRSVDARAINGVVELQYLGVLSTALQSLSDRRSDAAS